MRKKGRFFLVYSIILFSVAFILILFSSFTGVRYKDAQYEKSKLFQGAQQSVISLTEKNEQLEKENIEKKEQLKKANEEKITAEQNLEKEKEQKEIVVKNMDILASVQLLYNQKKYSEANELIKTIDITALSKNGRILYDSIKDRLS